MERKLTPIHTRDSWRVPFFQIWGELMGFSKHCKTKTESFISIISHHHPSTQKHKKVIINKKEEGRGEEEEMVRLVWLFTIQYRKDNLLHCISLTRDVSHFSKFEANSSAPQNTAKTKHQSIIHYFPSQSSVIKRKHKN